MNIDEARADPGDVTDIDDPFSRQEYVEKSFGRGFGIGHKSAGRSVGFTSTKLCSDAR